MFQRYLLLKEQEDQQQEQQQQATTAATTTTVTTTTPHQQQEQRQQQQPQQQQQQQQQHVPRVIPPRFIRDANSDILNRMDQACIAVGAVAHPVGPRPNTAESFMKHVFESAERQRELMKRRPVGEHPNLPPLSKPAPQPLEHKPFVNNHMPVGVARHDTPEKVEADS